MFSWLISRSTEKNPLDYKFELSHYVSHVILSKQVLKSKENVLNRKCFDMIFL